MSLGNAAAALNMNAAYLCALFSSASGLTVHTYLDELRLAEAKRLLRDPRGRVCEVAASVGYSSEGSFWRAFKAHTGLSPREWRES